MKVTRHVDWISATLDECDYPTLPFERFEWESVGHGLNGYENMLVSQPDGIVRLVGGKGENMGTHLQFSGKALHSIRTNYEMSDSELFEALFRSHASVSRLDLSINLHGGQLNAVSMNEMSKDGRMHTRAKKWRLWENYDDGFYGQTFEVGSRQSDRFFRAYDKNAEQRIVSEETWFRLELEVKNIVAKGLSQAVRQHGVDSVTCSAIGAVVDFDDNEYRQALNAALVGLPVIPRRETKTEKWLLGDVARSLAKVSIQNRQFLDLFMNKVKEEIDKTKI